MASSRPGDGFDGAAASLLSVLNVVALISNFAQFRSQVVIDAGVAPGLSANRKRSEQRLSGVIISGLTVIRPESATSENGAATFQKRSWTRMVSKYVSRRLAQPIRVNRTRRLEFLCVTLPALIRGHHFSRRIKLAHDWSARASTGEIRAARRDGSRQATRETTPKMQAATTKVAK